MSESFQVTRTKVELILSEYRNGHYKKRITETGIAEKVGCSTRRVREIVSELRKAGRPYGFDDDGMFMGRKGYPEDLDGSIASIESRIRKLYDVRRGLRVARRNLSTTTQERLPL